MAGDDSATTGPADGGSPSRPGASAPEVSAAEGASPADGVPQGEQTPGSDASVAAAGSFVARAAPGKPDGEVDTRTR